MKNHMEIDPEAVKFRVRIMEDPKTKALVTIDFGELVIKGYRIMVSSFTGEHGENLWVVPPAYNSKAGWKPIVHIVRKDKWKDIETRIVRQYAKDFKAYAETKMTGVVGDDIEPDDLDGIKF